MPPLPGLAPTPSPSLVPVIGVQGKRDKGKAPVRHPPRRQYNDEPLPVKPNTTAPKNAHIIGREQAHDGGPVGYRLGIGDVEINDVGVDEILDYVSALELEQFEMLKFRENAEILQILEQDREAERRAKLARAAERARAKGAVFVEEGSDSDGLAAFAESGGPAEVQVGKHGRARPDYSKFYKPPRGKGQKPFEDFADQETADDSMQTNDAEPFASQSGAQQELPKHRRRRRDPATGVLMPLAPSSPSPKRELEKKVRKRRKRHPVTGELMPLGWRYDPEAEGNADERRIMGLGSAMKDTSFKRLSISEQHEAKRPRLDTESANSSSVSPIPTKAEIMGQAASQSTPKGNAMKVVDLMSSDDEPKAAVSTPKSSMKPPPKQASNSMMRGTIASTATTSADESSPEPAPTSTLINRVTKTSPSAAQRTPRAQQPTTSILSPSATRASSTVFPPAASEDGTSDDEANEDEWFIESILGHRMSDPNSHPPELGKEPLMLYNVKWEGFAWPTWEPMDSFGDRSFVDAYRTKAGLQPIPKDEEDEEEDTFHLVEPVAENRAAASASSSKSATENAEDVEVYEFEKIVAHYLSDPRTHPKELGKIPVMLYQVKWKGWDEMTWEPEDSFDDDRKPLHAYKRKHRL